MWWIECCKNNPHRFHRGEREASCGSYSSYSFLEFVKYAAMNVSWQNSLIITRTFFKSICNNSGDLRIWHLFRQDLSQRLKKVDFPLRVNTIAVGLDPQLQSLPMEKSWLIQSYCLTENELDGSFSRWKCKNSEIEILEVQQSCEFIRMQERVKQKTVSRCGFDGESLPQGLCIAGSIYCPKFQYTSKRLQII